MCREAGNWRTWLGIVAVLVLFSARAEAAPRTYAVKISTSPSGATVFLNDEEGEKLGKTPFEGRLEAGTHPIFIRLEGYESRYETIDVERKRRGRQRFDFELKKLQYGANRGPRGGRLGEPQRRQNSHRRSRSRRCPR